MKFSLIVLSLFFTFNSLAVFPGYPSINHLPGPDYQIRKILSGSTFTINHKESVLIDSKLSFTLDRFFIDNQKVGQNGAQVLKQGVVIYLQQDNLAKKELKMYFSTEKGKSRTNISYGSYQIKFIGIKAIHKKINASFLVKKIKPD